MIIASRKKSSIDGSWQPFEVLHKSHRYPECFEGDKWPDLGFFFFFGIGLLHIYPTSMNPVTATYCTAKFHLIYPNRYLGQYLTCERLGVAPAWTLAFTREGLGGSGSGWGVFRLSLLLSVMVKPRSPLSWRLTLGKKWVETCWDLTRGLEPILAFPLLLRATNHSRPVLWFLWITEA